MTRHSYFGARISGLTIFGANGIVPMPKNIATYDFWLAKVSYLTDEVRERLA